MWSIIKAILLKFGALRGLLAVLGSLAAVLPIALAIIKFFGWPLMIVLLVVGFPLLLFLAVLGLPFIAVFTISGVVLATVAAVVMFGLIALKVFLFVVLPVWFAWRVALWACGWGKDVRRGPETPGAAAAS